MGFCKSLLIVLAITSEIDSLPAPKEEYCLSWLVIDIMTNTANENSSPTSHHTKYTEKHRMLTILENQSDADIRFVAQGGYNVWAHQNVLKYRSKKLNEWCSGYMPGEATRFIIVSNVSKESLEEFLKLVYTGELAVNESLKPDILVDILYLFERFVTMDKFFHLQSLYLNHLKKTLNSVYAVLVFIKARKFHILKDIEKLAWGLICGFVKNVVKFDFTKNTEKMKTFLMKEGMSLEEASYFGDLLRFSQPADLLSDPFSKTTEFICSVTLISFILRLKLSIKKTESIVKYLNADAFYNFSSDAFLEDGVIIPNPDGESTREIGLSDQVSTKFKSKGQSSFTKSLRRLRPEGYNENETPKLGKEYYVYRLFSCTDKFIFPNRGFPEELSFVSDTSIKLVKLGLYGCQEVPSYIDEYFVRLVLLDPKKNLILGTAAQVFRNTGTKFYVKFASPVPIKPHKKYTISAKIRGPPSCIGITKKSIVKVKCSSTIVTIYFPPDEENQGMKIPDIVFTL